MAYCTQQDILNSGISERELAELTSEEEGVINAATVAAAIKKADDEINSYVAVKYAVPLSPVPSLVNTWSTKITKYYLFDGRAHRMGGIPDSIRDGYKDSIAQLKDVAKGSLSIGIDPPPAAKSTGQPSVETNVGDDQDSRDFSKGKLRGF